jgi:predicted DCC family thiol-disulfide oxidoreductase YuxK
VQDPDVPADRDRAVRNAASAAAASAAGVAGAASVVSAGPIILFDGHCNLCSGWVRFVLAREGRTRFRFASLQSAAGQQLLAAHGVPPDLQTVVLIDEGRAFVRSAAALRTFGQLRAPWPLLSALRVCPAPLRDWIYRIVARHRYRWFGRQEVCFLPSPELKDRFL